MTTGAQIRAALSSVGGLGGQGWDLDTIAAGADDAMRAAGITTREGAACLVAQCMVESAYFRTTTEYAYKKGTPGWHNMQRYAPFIGRGFIQLTWRANYAKFGAWCKARGLVTDANTFVNQPTRLADPKWAWLGAVWYFTTHRHGLVALANKGDNVKVGRAINRGDAYSSYAAYGEDHRVAAYKALLRAGITAPAPAIGGVASPEHVYTRNEVRYFQRVHRLDDDGLWGPATEKQAQAIRRCLKPGLKTSKWDLVRYWRLRVAKGGQPSQQMRRAIQGALKVKIDGQWGPTTDAAWLAMRSQHRVTS